MADTNDFVIERALATQAAQASITATWQWEEMTDAEWTADIEALNNQKELVADKEAAKSADAIALDAKLDLLHERTQVGLSLFKVKHRGNPGLTHMLKLLTAEGGSRGKIMDEAVEFESQWQEWDPTWSPKPTETLATFQALLEEAFASKKPYATSKGIWRTEGENYNQMGIALNKLCKAWYEAATTVFKEGTAEGDMIRGTVPTTYTPPPPVPGKAVITSLTSPADGQALVVMEATGAETFRVLVKAPGSTTFSELAEDVAGPEFLASGFEVGGTYSFKVIGVNGNGPGEESDAQTVSIIKP